MSAYKEHLKQIIVDRIELIKNLDVIQRDFQLESNFPYVLTGIRRSGKTYLLYQIMNQLIKQGYTWEHFLYLNFEDERLIGFGLEDFQSIFDAFYVISEQEPILFLDEIQNVEGWERFVRRIADEKRLVYITGSNASMLSREIGSALGGRYLTKHVFTYSFAEFLRAKGFGLNKTSFYSSKGRGKLLKLFQEYFVYGGFPEVSGLVNKRDYLSSVYNKIFLGDVIARNKVSNVKALEILVKKIAESVCQPISYSRLTNIVKAVGVGVAKTTIIQYLDYLKDSHLVFSLENFSRKLVEKTTNPKYYFADTGILNLFLFAAEPLLLENLVAIALIRKFGPENVYFYKDKNSELDFYLPDQSLAIQVSYSVYDQATRKRKVSSLLNFNRFRQTAKNIILTFDQEDLIQKEGLEIRVIPISRWLLEHDESREK